MMRPLSMMSSLPLLLVVLLTSSTTMQCVDAAPYHASRPRSTTTAMINPLQRLQNDYRALTRRVTARQILLPPNGETACLELKRSILRRLEPTDDDDLDYAYIVDVFEEAAKKYSRDDSTKSRGGLIGELVPQGTCRSALLDEACFRVPIGSLQGPIESEFGIHLLLVTERTNCPKLDGTKTKLVPTPIRQKNSAYGVLVESSATTSTESKVTPSFVLGQAGFWAGTILAGGIVAELAARIAG